VITEQNSFFNSSLFGLIPSNLLDDFKRRPKIDLHRHREGAIRVSTLLELAPSIPNLPFTRDEIIRQVQIQPEDAHTSTVFLSKFGLLRQFYISKEIIQRTTLEVLEDAASDHVIYMELRISPTALSAAGAGNYSQVLDLVQQAALPYARQLNMQVQFIVLMNRHESLREAEKIIDLVMERSSEGYCGIDLAGDEAAFSGEAFIPLFRKVKQNGMHLTVHSGEWGPAENVRIAIQEFGAERIGHGCHTLEDPHVAKLARDQHIPFEVCLSSNILSGVVNDLSHHPIQKMLTDGLQVTLNTDDPSIQQTSLSLECALGVSKANITKLQVAQCMLTATHAAFLTQDEQALLAKQIAQGWQDILYPTC
jgi:adenosine deaminase